MIALWKQFGHNFYEFTGVIHPLRMKEKFEEFEGFLSYEPEVSDLQAFSLGLLNIPRRLKRW